MKNSRILLIASIFIGSALLMSMLGNNNVTSDNLQGAWEFTEGENKTVRINAGRYFSEGTFNKSTNAFVSARGGIWKIEGSTLTDTYEFDTEVADRVGTDIKHTTALKKDVLDLKTGDKKSSWKRVDDGKPGNLHGAWLFTGRKDGDELKPYTPGARKTMKILSGTRFQWAAYNTETKQFSGTGGGTYTTKDGKYVENIDFFSRDNTRVGASLDFAFNLQGDTWHHSGLSSKGDPIYELWSKRETLAGQ